MINAGKSIWAACKLNTAWSSKFKISLTSLFMYWYSTWHPTNTILRISVCHTTSEETWKIYDKESKIYFSTDGTLLLVWLPEWESTVVFIQSHFRPTGKKTPWVAPPPPSEIYLFQTPLPLGISITLHGGGMDIFWNHTLNNFHDVQYKAYLQINILKR